MALRRGAASGHGRILTRCPASHFVSPTNDTYRLFLLMMMFVQGRTFMLVINQSMIQKRQTLGERLNQLPLTCLKLLLHSFM
mmetsp:Transcript_35904/g.89474  ORF Transcript_35904/g.89474 Transcript_35904/m.89474 type:complete len:82 (-) Transcript_35904:117-362(-)